MPQAASSAFGLYRLPGKPGQELFFYCSACAQELGAEFVRAPEHIPLPMWQCLRCGSQPRWLSAL